MSKPPAMAVSKRFRCRAVVRKVSMPMTREEFAVSRGRMGCNPHQSTSPRSRSGQDRRADHPKRTTVVFLKSFRSFAPMSHEGRPSSFLSSSAFPVLENINLRSVPFKVSITLRRSRRGLPQEASSTNYTQTRRSMVLPCRTADQLGVWLFLGSPTLPGRHRRVCPIDAVPTERRMSIGCPTFAVLQKLQSQTLLTLLTLKGGRGRLFIRC